MEDVNSFAEKLLAKARGVRYWKKWYLDIFCNFVDNDNKRYFGLKMYL